MGGGGGGGGGGRVGDGLESLGKPIQFLWCFFCACGVFVRFFFWVGGAKLLV